MDDKFFKAKQSLIDLMAEKRKLSQSKKKTLLSESSEDQSLKKLVNEMMEHHNHQLNFVIQDSVETPSQHKVERVYSRKEIRKLVQENLIPTYQHDEIIEAVTDVFYSWHVS